MGAVFQASRKYCCFDSGLCDNHISELVVTHSSNSTRCCFGAHLLNDGTSIQVGRGVVSSCPDDLHPAGVSLVVRLGPHECREKAVVDVDGVLPVLVTEVLGENLHVPCQHDEVDRLLLQDFLNLRIRKARQDKSW